ncbi:hypothetical protein BJ875DRAFT_19441 [Amylocarpus encephaloides]|uniref:Uncharacterized protein n=1 Tax=Amylocarpus encephaloides TaxID=45428 RepID=A0A9P7YIS1_9HELO|nr:hypothetical protein BJ875DRAFT_19441 [Amylocarpus encephaloides]
MAREIISRMQAILSSSPTHQPSHGSNSKASYSHCSSIDLCPFPSSQLHLRSNPPFRTSHHNPFASPVPPSTCFPQLSSSQPPPSSSPPPKQPTASSACTPSRDSPPPPSNPCTSRSSMARKAPTQSAAGPSRRPPFPRKVRFHAPDDRFSPGNGTQRTSSPSPLIKQLLRHSLLAMDSRSLMGAPHLLPRGRIILLRLSWRLGPCSAQKSL